MKSLAIITIIVLVIACCSIDSQDDKGVFISDYLALDAEVIMRADCVHNIGGNKYSWQVVKVIEIYKNDIEYDFPEEFRVAHLSWEKGLPLGISTIYLERYNADRNDLWKLVDGKCETGMSHHEIE